MKPKSGSKAQKRNALVKPGRLTSSKISEVNNEINDLVELLKIHDLAELEVEHKGVRIRARRSGGGEPSVTMVTESARAVSGQPASRPADEMLAADQSNLVVITSPIVGTFYRSPSPDADAYVEEGDFVKKGQVLCVVEAMKLMNEIESEVDGRIHKILAESTKPVEYGQPLYLIDPTATS